MFYMSVTDLQRDQGQKYIHWLQEPQLRDLSVLGMTSFVVVVLNLSANQDPILI